MGRCNRVTLGRVMSKSNAIRELLAERPDASNQEIVDALEERGVAVTRNLVKVVRSRMTKPTQDELRRKAEHHRQLAEHYERQIEEDFFGTQADESEIPGGLDEDEFDAFFDGLLKPKDDEGPSK